jgi:hypothetical protein
MRATQKVPLSYSDHGEVLTEMYTEGMLNEKVESVRERARMTEEQGQNRRLGHSVWSWASRDLSPQCSNKRSEGLHGECIQWAKGHPALRTAHGAATRTLGAYPSKCLSFRVRTQR